ncbi:ImmA/IrrE family metallo-endopeptidase [Sneathiella sp.]|uniref:ImmA/IrrE family metallo-endopeptidase n=1 Tax=Sneathiella sp. TaxID=1964365 RepID=UPI0026362B63|nr:ImmA/IrrE family metallo-endopeptidase [Sneathiella sp.]MDF2367210.1 ImmA/IrrE family metallo-endopeptidase [Sneathiella sp.]
MAHRSPIFAELEAEDFIRKLGIEEFPINPIAIAENVLDITVMAKPTSSKGVSGMLMRMGEEYGIAYATHIENKGFQHFCVAHEIGHYKLPGHIEHVFADGSSVHHSRAGNFTGDPFEVEADHFAAGLLMPDPLFSREMKRSGVGLDAVEKLRIICDTSLEATGIRYVSRIDVPTAIIRSVGQQIEYCSMSKSLKEIDGLEWIKKGTPVPQGTATWRLNADTKAIESGVRLNEMTDLSVWFNGSRNIELHEEVVGLGSYGKILTIIYAQDNFDIDEYDDDEDLEDSYEVRFHKR